MSRVSREILELLAISLSHVALPDRDSDTRLQVSLRLKAARYLAGSRATEGRQAGSAIPLGTAELAQQPVLVENKIAKGRIEEIEQMKVDARPMELEKLAEALGVSHDFLLSPIRPRGDQVSGEELVDEMRRLARLHEQLLNQRGRDIGRRDLRSRDDEDPPAERDRASG